MDGLDVGSPFRIGVTFSLRNDYPWQDGLVEDAAAECDDMDTVLAIARALEPLGTVVLLADRPDLPERLIQVRPDVVFNIAEGWSGRNRESLIPAILEHMDIPYTGSDPLTLGLALSKGLAKAVVSAEGIPTTPWVVCRSAENVGLPFGFPVFVKPNEEGSSKGVTPSSLVHDERSLRDVVSRVTGAYGQPAIIEPFLPGREFSIGVLGNGCPRAFPVMEVAPHGESGSGPFVYTYQTKVSNLERFICPADVDDGLAASMVTIAQGVFRALDIRDLARVDIRLDDRQRPMFMEVNPLPGLSSGSLYPVQAAASGLNHADLVREILLAACRRRGLVLEGVA